MTFKAKFSSVAIIMLVYQYAFFGFSYLDATSSFLDILSYTLTFLLFIWVVYVFVQSKLIVDQLLINDLLRLMCISLLLGPIFYFATLIWYGPPILSSNVEVARVIFRQNNPMVRIIILPMVSICTMLSSFIYVFTTNRKLPLLILLLCSVVGVMSGFRASGIVPWISLIMLWFYREHSLYSLTRILKNFAFTLSLQIKLICAVLLSSLLIFYISVARTGTGDILQGEIISLIYRRVFEENVIVNFQRYFMYAEDNGFQLGGTYLTDIASVLGLAEQSFQELLSTGEYLVMTTPVYAELYVNFGAFSFLAIVILFLPVFFLYRVVLMLAAKFVFDRRSLPSYRAVLHIYFLLQVVPSIGQAGISKYLLVAIPKFFIALLIFYFLDWLLLRFQSKFKRHSFSLTSTSTQSRSHKLL